MLCYVFWSQVEYGIVCFVLKVAREPGIRQGPGFGGKLKRNLKKNSVDQIFTGENKKKAEFFTFFEVYVFSRWNFSWSVGQFFGSSITHTL